MRQLQTARNRNTVGLAAPAALRRADASPDIAGKQTIFTAWRWMAVWMKQR